jgi:hypothetical protein
VEDDAQGTPDGFPPPLNGVPVPLSETTKGLFGAESSTRKYPSRSPVPVGANVT